ncbi:DUF1036 domain-containing protein [Rhodopseudomonas sp. HC1]|uniref:DUF1036 domain-containing protein n=1 Tax=Rhodopseudomonas infernalis TaxID=2897386 RepID=UPI001EE98F61|nr:DUF1036 domain-containing protein [Rhodopseudomonas infernalis]MCG6207969.1 DUF1036 domain-containing protein [Rhodopseudomonas infernalis]
MRRILILVAGLLGLQTVFVELACAQTYGGDANTFTLKYCNRDTDEIALALSFLENPSGPYIVRGWFRVDVNECKTLRFSRGTFYYFAQRYGAKFPTWGSDDLKLCVSYPGPFRYRNADPRECSGDEEKRPFTSVFVRSDQSDYELSFTTGNRNPTWHAIAIANGSGWVSYGYSGPRASEAQAREHALDECRKRAKLDRCTVSKRNVASAGCMFMTSGNSRRGLIWQTGPDREELFESCRSSGYKCKDPIGGCIR